MVRAVRKVSAAVFYILSPYEFVHNLCHQLEHFSSEPRPFGARVGALSDLGPAPSLLSRRGSCGTCADGLTFVGDLSYLEPTLQISRRRASVVIGPRAAHPASVMWVKAAKARR
jgi:hypothetical protein